MTVALIWKLPMVWHQPGPHEAELGKCHLYWV